MSGFIARHYCRCIFISASENIGEKAAESPDPATRSGSQLTALRSSSALDPATDNNVPPLEMDEDAGQEDRILTCMMQSFSSLTFFLFYS